MLRSDEYYMDMMAQANEAGGHESKEEKLLWEKRSWMGKIVEKEEKMMHNAQELMKSDWTRADERQALRDEVNKMQREIQEVRAKIALVDRAIRESGIDGLEEGEWEAKVTKLVAKEPKEYACALGQARQRM
jgi:predicted  nucleic acid-binding Zn-ribbon protein